MAQSALVRVRKVSVHRALGWFGAALARNHGRLWLHRFRSHTPSRHDAAQPQQDCFVPVELWADMFIFGACMALAIYFRKRAEHHRRLVFMASCQLMQAAFVRFPYIGRHDLFYPALDLLILAGVLRDRIVDGRVNRIYIYVFPAIIALQAWATYLERVNPSWWQAATQAIFGS